MSPGDITDKPFFIVRKGLFKVPVLLSLPVIETYLSTANSGDEIVSKLRSSENRDLSFIILHQQINKLPRMVTRIPSIELPFALPPKDRQEIWQTRYSTCASIGSYELHLELTVSRSRLSGHTSRQFFHFFPQS